MRNLARPLLRLLGRDDRGAVGVLVAVLLGGGVLLGMGALVVDVGQIYQNRAELQNGADAAALAVARQCAQGTCTQGSAQATADAYANLNASALTQGNAGVDCVRGSDSLTCVPTIVSSNPADLADCPPDPVGVNFVDVQTQTTLASGSTLLPPVFAETLVGGSTYNGTNVKACAQATWGPPGGLALTISDCEWSVATGGAGNPVLPAGNNVWDQSGSPPSSFDTQFLIHSGNNTPNTTCNDGPANQDAPGAFGWTADLNGDCETVVNADLYGAKPGNSATADCQAALTELVQTRKPVSVPVFSAVAGTGNNTLYTLDGYATAVITGFHVPGDTVPDWLNGPLLCGPPDTCVDGYLVSNTLSQTANFPVTVNVKLTG